MDTIFNNSNSVRGVLVIDELIIATRDGPFVKLFSSFI